jgi:hypothetical protein
MESKELNRAILEIYQDARLYGSNKKIQGWEKQMLTAYRRLRLLRDRVPDGKFIIEGDSGEAYFAALMELFGCIESRITELGLQ